MIKLIIFILFISNAFSGTDLYVGYSGKNNNFNTVQEAVNKAASLNPSSESARVTIHIKPGTYRQQVMVQTPYITFVNDESSGEVVLTWYYGIGYKYYSANDKGYYDANSAKSKSSKHPAKYRWGATVLLTNKAQYFKAKNIVFENSFNRYMTNEEVADGVEVLGDSNTSPINVQRNGNLDVKSKAATERGAALAADAGYCEFLNCKFYSSQDTLYTGASPLYFKNCLIEGQTDYIFGESNVVFDSCELRWKGYSSGSVGGYITAARAGDGSYTGMLMYNCKVTKNKGLTVSPGYFGRPWRDTAKVKFINTVLEDGNTIAAEGWGSMSGVLPENVAGFKEYGTKLSNGAAVSTSNRKGHILSQADAEKTNIIDYLNKWTPSFK
jgi:pectin methylesterase-like acyl-CoA thioesterase